MKQCTHSACFILVLFLSLLGQASANEWKQQTSKDGTVDVQSQVQEITIQGKTVDVVEYLASTQTKVKKQKKVTFKLRAAPDRYPMQDVDRMTLYDAQRRNAWKNDSGTMQTQKTFSDFRN